MSQPRLSPKLRVWAVWTARKAGTWLRAEVAELKAEANPRSLFFCSDLFTAPPNAISVSQAHGRIDFSPAQPNEQMSSREVPVGSVPEAQRPVELCPLAAREGLCIAESEPCPRLVETDRAGPFEH
jgi:hypothetical protein